MALEREYKYHTVAACINTTNGVMLKKILSALKRTILYIILVFYELDYLQNPESKPLPLILVNHSL